MEVKAQLKYLSIAPRKVRIVANLIKGMDVRRALLELDHLPKQSALPLAKLVQSAIANAAHNFRLQKNDLYVKEILVNQGTVLRRFMPRAFGRAAPIRKRTSHVSLVLASLGVSTAKQKAKKRETGPALRELTKEDVQERFTAPMKEEKQELRGTSFHKAKAKPTNFVRRIFKRKAI